MNRPGKLRYVNQLVGSLVLLVGLLLLVALYWVARRQDWLVERYQVYALLPERDLDGLRPGSDVVMLGNRVGQIERLEYAPLDAQGTPQLQVVLSLRRDPKWPVYLGAELHVRRYLAGAGDAYLEIRRSSQTGRQLRDGDTLPMFVEGAATDRLSQVVDVMREIRQDFAAVRDSMVPAFERMRETVDHLDQTNDSLQSVVSDFQEFSPKLSPLADQTQQVLDGSQRVVEDFQRFAPRLAPLADQAEQLIQTGQEAMETIRQETESLPGTVRQVREGVTGAQEVVDGLRSHWLLRRYIDRGDAQDTIAPAEVGRGGYWP